MTEFSKIIIDPSCVHISFVHCTQQCSFLNWLLIIFSDGVGFIISVSILNSCIKTFYYSSFIHIVKEHLRL